MRHQSAVESNYRTAAKEWLRFSLGEQWEAELQNTRLLEQRPCLTINKVEAFIRQITNQQRQQRPQGRAHPVDSFADIKTAEVLNGIFRHIAANSNADSAYDKAFDFAVRIGFGFWRVRTDYTREDSFDQDIFVDSVDDPFSTMVDGVLPDGSDAERGIITTMIRKSEFKRLYPDANPASFIFNDNSDAEWVNEDEVRVGEFYCLDRVSAKLLMLSNRIPVFEDDYLKNKEKLDAVKVTVVGERASFRRRVTWSKITNAETLETRVIPGRFIPIVPVVGADLLVDGKRRRFGVVKDAMDPQTQFNFWETAATEKMAMTPKAKWLIPAGADEGFENEFAQANVSSKSSLHWNPFDANGRPLPAPTYIQPEGPPVGFMEMVRASSDNLQAVMGMYDPAMGKPSGQKSGKAVIAEQTQSDQSNFHFYDNLTLSIKHTCRIFLNLTPSIYDVERVQRIIGDDGRPSLVTLNERKAGEGGIETVLHNVTVGQYDVVMDTGPGYNTKRKEGQEAMLQLLGIPALGEKVASVGDDLIVRMIDSPGMQDLADRLAASNPFSKIDEQSDIPPKAQMMIQALQKQTQEMGQQMEGMANELKYRFGIEKLKDEGATKRTLITATAHTHGNEITAAGDAAERDISADTRRHDTEVKAQTALGVAEINGLVSLLSKLKDFDLEAFRVAAAREDAELATKSKEDATL